MANAYTAAVASHKGVIGIGLPLKSLRRKPQSPHLVCGFVVRAPSFGGSIGGREPGRFHASGFPVDQPVELPPRLVSEWRFLQTETTGGHTLALSAPARTSAQSPVSPSFDLAPASDPIQLHAEAHNALAMALHYLRQPEANVPGAARKAVQALAALRRITACEGVAS
jgi:hypothetical protein